MVKTIKKKNNIKNYRKYNSKKKLQKGGSTPEPSNKEELHIYFDYLKFTTDKELETKLNQLKYKESNKQKNQYSILFIEKEKGKYSDFLDETATSFCKDVFRCDRDEDRDTHDFYIKFVGYKFDRYNITKFSENEDEDEDIKSNLALNKIINDNLNINIMIRILNRYPSKDISEMSDEQAPADLSTTYNNLPKKNICLFLMKDNNGITLNNDLFDFHEFNNLVDYKLYFSKSEELIDNYLDVVYHTFDGSGNKKTIPTSKAQSTVEAAEIQARYSAHVSDEGSDIELDLDALQRINTVQDFYSKKETLAYNIIEVNNNGDCFFDSICRCLNHAGEDLKEKYGSAVYDANKIKQLRTDLANFYNEKFPSSDYENLLNSPETNEKTQREQQRAYLIEKGTIQSSDVGSYTTEHKDTILSSPHFIEYVNRTYDDYIKADNRGGIYYADQYTIEFIKQELKIILIIIDKERKTIDCQVIQSKSEIEPQGFIILEFSNNNHYKPIFFNDKGFFTKEKDVDVIDIIKPIIENDCNQTQFKGNIKEYLNND